MNCKHCGAQLRENAAFCSTCGMPVEKKYFCASCGAELEGGQAFCHMCGAKCSENDTGMLPSQEPKDDFEGKVELKISSTAANISSPKEISKVRVQQNKETQHNTKTNQVHHGERKNWKLIFKFPLVLKTAPVFLILLVMLVAFFFWRSKDTAAPVSQFNSPAVISGGNADQERIVYYEPQTMSNSLTCEINGQGYEMSLKEAKVFIGKNIRAVYQAQNPRGEVLYRLTISMDKDLGVGTYSSDKKVSISLSEVGSGSRSYETAYGIGPQKLWGRDLGSYTFSITKRSDDWRTYEGTFSATLEQATKSKSNDMIRLTNCSFNFTLQ